MAWNGSGRTQETDERRAAPRPRRKLTGVYIALTVIVCGIIALYVINRSRTARTAEEAVSKPVKARIAEIAPTVDTNRPSDLVEKKKDELPEGVYKDNSGILRWPGGAAYVVRKEDRQRIDPNRIIVNGRDINRRIFKHKSENHLAGLITTPLGTPMIGRPRYNESMDEDFKAALNEPIEIKDEDSDEDKALKREMIELKKELKPRIDAGEKFSDILREARNELEVMASCKRDLKKELRKVYDNESYTDQDVKDCVEAINIMLKEKGITGLKMPDLMERNVRLQILREKTDRKALGTQIE